MGMQSQTFAVLESGPELLVPPLPQPSRYPRAQGPRPELSRKGKLPCWEGRQILLIRDHQWPQKICGTVLLRAQFPQEAVGPGLGGSFECAEQRVGLGSLIFWEISDQESQNDFFA